MLEKVCCPAAAARRVKQLNIDGNLVGITQLDTIIQEVLALGLNTEKEIRKELLTRLQNYNYIPANKEDSYATALFTEYCKNAK